MTMNLDNFTSLVERFGSEPGNWPAEERQAALEFIAEEQHAALVLAQYEHLDSLLNQAKVPDNTVLLNKILHQELPARRAAKSDDGSLLDHIVDWLFPRSKVFPTQFWRPAVVACFPLVFGLLLGNFFSFGIQSQQNNWDDELALLSLTDYSETSL